MSDSIEHRPTVAKVWDRELHATGHQYEDGDKPGRWIYQGEDVHYTVSCTLGPPLLEVIFACLSLKLNV